MLFRKDQAGGDGDEEDAGDFVFVNGVAEKEGRHNGGEDGLDEKDQ